MRLQKKTAFITAAGGPAVNLLLCVIAGVVLSAVWHLKPNFDPLPSWETAFVYDQWNWAGSEKYATPIIATGTPLKLSVVLLLVAQLFWMICILLFL